MNLPLFYRTVIGSRLILQKLAPLRRRQLRQLTGKRYVVYFFVGLIYSRTSTNGHLYTTATIFCPVESPHTLFNTQFLLLKAYIFDIPQSNQTPRRGNVANNMAPPSPSARDSHSPSRGSPSSSSKSVPGYMQPTRSSGASKGSGTPRARKGSEKKRWCRRPFIRDYFSTIE